MASSRTSRLLALPWSPSTVARPRLPLHAPPPTRLAAAACGFKARLTALQNPSTGASLSATSLVPRYSQSLFCRHVSKSRLVKRWPHASAHSEAGSLEDQFGRSEYVRVAEDVELHCVVADPPGKGADDPAPVVLLLHGFPEFWYSWRKQIGPLAVGGFRVVAPDMRGYNKSSKPPRVADYATPLLVADVVALARHYAPPEARGRAEAVVGHDWGGAVAWGVAIQAPQAVRRLAVLNLPHPQRFQEGLRTLPQLRKSWYMAAFQTPFAIPERIFAASDFALLRRVFASDPDPPFSAGAIERYVEAYRGQPGAIAAAVNYYRAAFRGSGGGAPFSEGALRTLLGATASPGQVDCPVLVLWGERDAYLGKEMCDPPRDLVPDCELVTFPQATHWVQHDMPDEVNAQLLRFLSK